MQNVSFNDIAQPRAVRARKVAANVSLGRLVAASAAITVLGSTAYAAADWSQTTAWDAIVGGTDSDGAPLQVCRANYAGGQHPGKTRKGWYSCDIGYGGQELWVSSYETLQPNWEWGTLDNAGADPFGYEPTSGGDTQDLWVCKAGAADGSLQVGKAIDNSGCHVPYGGAEIVISTGWAVLRQNQFDLEEVDATNGLPPNAIIGGYDSDGANLYPCLGHYNGGVHPGKTRAGWNSCDIAYGGGEYWVSNYQVLVPKFLAASLLSNFVAAHEADGASLGVCKASYGGGVQVGKFLIAQNRCNFGFGGGEVSLTSGFTYMTNGFNP
jgi:hypothetical protein